MVDDATQRRPHDGGERRWRSDATLNEKKQSKLVHIGIGPPVSCRTSVLTKDRTTLQIWATCVHIGSDLGSYFRVNLYT